MERRRVNSSLLAVMFLLSMFFVMAAFPMGACAEKQDVLILHAYHKGYKWTDEVGEGMESALKAAGLDLGIQIEYLDTKRVSGDTYFLQQSEVFKQRFEKRKFKVVLTSDDDAFNFMLKYREKIFGEPIPVVFAGCNDFDLKRLDGVKNVTGVNEAADFKEGIDLVLKVHPDTRKIIVVNDVTITGQKAKAAIQEVIPSYSDMIRFEFTDDLDMDQLVEKLKKTPQYTIVFYTFYAKDKTGKFFEFNESITRVSKASPVPVYSAWDFNLGYGTVGGKLTSGFYQGQAAGEKAVQILKGESVDKIPVLMKSPNKYMFDWQQLDRFSIKMSQLPADSIFINKPKYSMIHIGLIGAGILILCIFLYIYKKVL